MLVPMALDSTLAFYFILVFLTAFALTCLLTPLTAHLASRLGFLDQPAPRRLHLVPTPRHGGIPLCIAFVAALAVTLPFPRTDAQEPRKLLGLMLGLMIVALVGAYDDARELKPLPQFIAQLVAAGIAIMAGGLLTQNSHPLPP